MIYLDNAATTFPKPPSVTEAMHACMEEFCGNPGRGSHTLSLRAAETLYTCRKEAAELFGADSPEHVVFTQNATYALNTAIKGLIPAGAHVILSDMEHNSVLRPVEALRRGADVEYDIFSTEGNDLEITERIRCLFRKNTAAVICTAASNICNRTLPVRQIGRMCARYGIYFILDASQAAGIQEIHMRRDHITALCMPGHKGLLGPQGTGLLLLREGVSVAPLAEGGSGIHSEDPEMPEFLPDRLEAGTMNTPGIAGLCAGIRYVRCRGVESIRQHEAGLYRALRASLRGEEKVRIYGGSEPGAILLFNIDGISPQKVGQELDAHGICVRSGLHCAPLAHRTLEVPPGGAVRVSFGPFSTARDVTALLAALREIIKKG